jgi:hypothetical protein
LTAAGELDPAPFPAPAPTAAVEGYDVRLDGGMAAGAGSELVFRVARRGAAVTDLEAYLGAYGHLVAIRSSDGAYLHVHPTGASSPEQVAFAVHAPSAGTYRLFLDFQHRGVVHTAAFTLEVPAGAPALSAHGEGDGHGEH